MFCSAFAAMDSIMRRRTATGTEPLGGGDKLRR
jgi:hypothetical protein